MSAAGGSRRGKTEAAELPVDLEWRRPEMRPAADICAAAGIYGDERADRVAVAGHRGGRAQSALEVDGGGAEARPGGTQGKDLAGARGGGVAEIAVRREAPPVLVAAIEQVEQRGPANDRHCGYLRSQSRGRARAGGLARRPRRQGRRPSRRTAPRRRCARRCDAAQAGRSRAWPGRRRARRPRPPPARRTRLP